LLAGLGAQIVRLPHRLKTGLALWITCREGAAASRGPLSSPGAVFQDGFFPAIEDNVVVFSRPGCVVAEFFFVTILKQVEVEGDFLGELENVLKIFIAVALQFCKRYIVGVHDHQAQMLKSSWIHGTQAGFVVIGGIRDTDKVEIDLVFDRERGTETTLANEEIDCAAGRDVENVYVERRRCSVDAVVQGDGETSEAGQLTDFGQFRVESLEELLPRTWR
jgi:hypothetical protein